MWGHFPKLEASTPVPISTQFPSCQFYSRTRGGDCSIQEPNKEDFLYYLSNICIQFVQYVRLYPSQYTKSNFFKSFQWLSIAVIFVFAKQHCKPHGTLLKNICHIYFCMCFLVPQVRVNASLLVLPCVIGKVNGSLPMLPCATSKVCLWLRVL
jgi:hypothetical protein